MKTLILQDEVFERLLELLGESDEGKDLIRSFARGPAMPSDRELVAMARDGSDPPEAVARARAFRDAGRRAAVDTRETMEDVLLHCHGAGVGPAVLMRWFGLNSARTYEVLAKAKGPSTD
jgi:hypothetical protein